jgi:hypothetical protein
MLMSLQHWVKQGRFLWQEKEKLLSALRLPGVFIAHLSLKKRPSALSRKFCIPFWQFIMSQDRCKMYQNSNIEIRNPKQYQNPNAQNSKQMRSGTVAFRFCH